MPSIINEILNWLKRITGLGSDASPAGNFGTTTTQPRLEQYQLGLADSEPDEGQNRVEYKLQSSTYVLSGAPKGLIVQRGESSASISNFDTLEPQWPPEFSTPLSSSISGQNSSYSEANSHNTSGFLAQYLAGAPSLINLPDDAEVQQAIDTAGMPKSLAKIILNVNNSFGSLTFIRFGTRPHSDIDLMSKPIVLHSKSCNHGLLYGFFAADYENLSKIDGKRQLNLHAAKTLYEQDTVPHNTDEESPVKAVPLKRTLRQVLRAIYIDDVNTDKQADLEIVNMEANGDLVLKYRQGSGPEKFQGQFLVKLSEAATAEDRLPYYDPLGDPIRDKDDAIATALLNTNLLHYKDFLDKEVSIEYTTDTTQSAFRSLEVLAIKNRNGNYVPATGDWDIEMGTCPQRIPLEYNTVYSSSNQGKSIADVDNLVAMTQQLFEYIKKQDPPEPISTILTKAFNGMAPNRHTDGKDITLEDLFIGGTITELAKNSGCITPFEFFQNVAMNFLFAVDKYGPDYKQAIALPFQHGGQNRSPCVNNPLISPDEEGSRLAIGKLDGQDNVICRITQNTGEIATMLQDAIKTGQQVDVHPSTKSEHYQRLAVLQCIEHNYLNPAIIPEEIFENWVPRALQQSSASTQSKLRKT